MVPSVAGGGRVSHDDLDLTAEIIRERLDKLDTENPSVQIKGSRILVRFSGAENIDPVATKTARLELYDLQKNLIGPSIDESGFPRAEPSLFKLVSAASSRADRASGSFYLFRGTRLVAGPMSASSKLLHAEYVRRAGTTGRVPPGHTLVATPANTTVLRCGSKQRYCPGVNEAEPSRTYYYLFKFDPDNKKDPVPEMTGEDINIDGTRQDFDTQSNQPIVTMQFTDKGGDKFHDITRELALRGRILMNRNNVDPELAFQQFAIVLDNVIQSAPTIDFNENPDGIPPDNGAQITGIGSLSEAKDLALVLQTGALPVHFDLARCSPTEVEH